MVDGELVVVGATVVAGAAGVTGATGATDDAAGVTVTVRAVGESPFALTAFI